MPLIKRLLTANRSEIAIRVFRTAHELGIRTVALYSHEDRYALHRFKADEAYLVGRQGEPLKSYLNVDRIIELAQRQGIDAVHPGYGFLSENPGFARACREAGILFVGPSPELLEQLGNKVTARKVAQKCGVPVLAGSERAIRDVADGKRLSGKMGYPVILKAARGGGGRGMRIVRKPSEFAAAFALAQGEAQSAFDSSDLLVEKYVERARHVEVQLLGDEHGSLVHLYERDCSVQRRHQKVVEIAPAPALGGMRDQICEAALAIGREVNYENAGTVEFLLDVDTNEFYFIEVNPRIQVEHTVTEQVTGIDIVKCQILIAQGASLSDPEIGLASQANVRTNGFAVQCRVTTEDPANDFLPDHGRISHYRSAAGMGIRLDAGTAFSGATVTPFYDSLLVKVTAWGHRYLDATRRMERSLQEFRIRGVRTNIPFLTKLIVHSSFVAGGCTTRFIDETPELFKFPERRDRATKVLTFLSEMIVNGNSMVKDRPRASRRTPAPVPSFHLDAGGGTRVTGGSEPLPVESSLDSLVSIPSGTRQLLESLGPEGFAKWILDQERLLLTDTTFRDAHQSLLATRFRTSDLLSIAETYARLCPGLFSLEMWGGATFDTAMRFLKECPWERLVRLRERVPNILFQMLLRSSNAVGYTHYPDNVVKEFVAEAAGAGIDVFRIFDALNITSNMRVAMEAVRKTDRLCEAAICYSGDILDPDRTKYDLQYYVDLARRLEGMGAHILAIKDMAGLCKPYAAQLLVKTLKQEIGIPVHFHTHDTSGLQSASILKASEEGLDIADAAFAPLAGGTSQPNLNTLVESLRFGERNTELVADSLDLIAEYWQGVREFYLPFESPVPAAGADLYRHQMPGGQYTNLMEQARALDLADRWPAVGRMYADVNQMLGDIVKVTPTSKAVGDLALFLVANDLTTEDVVSGERELTFPQSVIDLLDGSMGLPKGGFPSKVRKRILGDRKPVRGRPGKLLPAADFEQTAAEVRRFLRREPRRREVVSYLLYPEVYQQFVAHQQRYSDTAVLPTPVFFFGMEVDEEIAVEIESGKTLIIKLITVGEPNAEGQRTVFFELNGQPREVTVPDRSLRQKVSTRVKAQLGDPSQIAAPMPGMVVSVEVREGDPVVKGQKLLTLEAMKMQTEIAAEHEGQVTRLLVSPGSQVERNDLLLSLG